MKKKMKYGLSLISLIITVIVIIILATIIIFSGMTTPDRANFAKFVEEISSYKMAITEDYMKKKSDYALEGITHSDEQIYYIIATGDESAVDVNTIPIETGLIDDLVVEMFPEKLSGTKYFEIISDTNINGISKQKTFYEPAEKHYITDTGEVFILPGYLIEENGNHKWYVSENKYYTDNHKDAGNKLLMTNTYSIGDYVDYSPKADEYTPTFEITGATNQKLETDIGAKWRVIYAGSEKVYITPGIVNIDAELMLNGNTGYFNGVNELDNICETLYSNKDKGIIAKSLSILDMNKICNYKENFTTGYKYFLKSAEYGDEVEEIVDDITYTISQATMKKRFFTGTGGTTKYFEGIPYQTPASGDPVYVKNTCYSYNYPNATIKDIINFEDVNGWVASTCENTNDAYTEYGLFVLDNNGINQNFLARSTGMEISMERWSNTISYFR